MAQANDEEWLNLANGGPILDSIVKSANYKTLKALALTNRDFHRKVTARFRNEVAQIRAYYAPLVHNSVVINDFNDQRLLELIYHLNGGQSASTDDIIIDINDLEYRYDTRVEKWTKDVNEFVMSDIDDGVVYTEHWTTNGQYNRVDGPAYVNVDNGVEYRWYKDGRMNRSDGPAHIILKDETVPGCRPSEKYWYRNGVLHHVEKTKYVNDENYCIQEKQYYVNGELIDTKRIKADYSNGFDNWDETDEPY